VLRLALRLTLLLLCALLPGRAWAAVGAPSEIRVTGEAAENRVKGLEAQLVYCTHRSTLATPRLHLGNEPALRGKASAPLFRWKGRWWSDFGGPDGTYDMRARVWSPELGIFLSADDFGFHDANGTLWSWPNQNPVNLSDPSGNLGENNGAGTLPWFLRGIEGLNNFDMGVRTRAQGIDLMHNESTFELGLSMYICGSEQMVQGFGQTVETGGFIVNVADVVIGLGKAAAAMGGGSFISNGMGGGGGTRRGPTAGGGAKVENLKPGDIVRIQNAADRTGQTIAVVGSRARGTAHGSSDWDYVMSGNSAQRHSARSSVPRGRAGGEITAGGNPSGIDILRGSVDRGRPHIIFTPGVDE
jgi:RHS repeat-associated protein